VTVVDPWIGHVDAMNRNGLRVETVGGGFVVSIPALVPDQVPTLEAPIDLLIISVKAYDTEAAYKLDAPKLSVGTTVV
jgi:2-dehydropantoate 2-reductase